MCACRRLVSSTKPHDFIACLGDNLGNIAHRVSVLPLLLKWKFVVSTGSGILLSFVVTFLAVPPSAG